MTGKNFCARSNWSCEQKPRSNTYILNDLYQVMSYPFINVDQWKSFIDFM